LDFDKPERTERAEWVLARYVQKGWYEQVTDVSSGVLRVERRREVEGEEQKINSFELWSEPWNGPGLASSWFLQSHAQTRG